MKKKIKVLDLFSGLGLFSLAARNVFQERFESSGFCEIDTYCQEQIKNTFEGAIIHDNIETFNSIPKKADIITAGFPCTDISIATPVSFEKKSDRIHGERSGLWKHIIRIARKTRPKFIIMENSSNIVRSGLGEIIRALSESRYCICWNIISAQEFGFPHLRRRWYAIAADTDSIGLDEIQIFCRELEKILHQKKSQAKSRLEGEFSRLSCTSFWSEDYSKFCQMDNEYTAEENQNDIKAAGNAIIPDIAEMHFQALLNTKLLE